MRSIVFAVSLLVLVSLSFSINVSSCQAITSPGSYVLINDLSGAPIAASEVLASSTACVKIASSGVVLDCNGFDISNNGTLGTTYGILLNGSATDVTVQNCPSVTQYLYGVYLFQADANRIDGVTAFNNSNAIRIDAGSDSNNITDSVASGSAGRGFWLDGSSFNRLIDNNATANGQEGFILTGGANNNILTSNIATSGATQGGFTIGGIGGGSSNNILTNNLASGYSGVGFACIVTADNNTYTGNTAYNNTLDGFFFQTCTNGVLTGNNATLNGQSGYIFQVGATGNILTTNTANNNGDEGFRFVSGSSNNTISSNTASFNGLRGYTVELGSDSNTLGGNSANSNAVGYLVFSSSFTGLLGNVAINSTGAGFIISGSTNSTLNGNVAVTSGDAGFTLGGSPNGTLIGNVASTQVADGFDISTSDDLLLANNVAVSSGDAGISISGTDNIRILDNVVVSQAGDGFDVSSGSDNLNFTNNVVLISGDAGLSIVGSDNVALNRNTIHSNTAHGVLLSGTNNTVITADRYFGNSPDFEVSGTGVVLNMSGVVFDGPGGNLTNYTNLSLTDIVSSAYSIDNTGVPAALPPSTASFAGKFVEIIETSPTVSIDSITWHWQDSESTGLNEQGFRLWEYDGAWTLLPVAPNETTNTLSASNLSNFSVFAILQTVTTTGGGDDSGGGSGGNPDLSMGFDPDGNEVTVTSGGEPVPGATVRVNGSIIGTTDSDGKISFPGCGGTAFLSATKAGYGASELDVSLSSCPGCTTDLDCPATMQCTSGVCGPVACACGSVSNHQCVAFQCCADSDCPAGQMCSGNSCVPEQPDQCTSDSECPATESCDLASGACVAVQCSCGSVSNHQCVSYECCSDSDCPGGMKCQGNECVQPSGDLSCPSTGVVGGDTSCKATEDGGSCANCDYQVTDPAGKKFSGKTDQSGNFGLPLTIEGTYQVALIRDGQVIKTIAIKALPKTTPSEGEPPTASSSPDLGMVIFLLVILALVVLGILYWRRRSKS